MPRGKNRSSRNKKTAGSVPKAPSRKKQSANDIFALDIGTRNVVGIIGHMVDGVFNVDKTFTVPHRRRAMMDGQIEDIGEAAKVVLEVKEKMEELSGIRLTNVAIAAAGRALVTKRSVIEHDIEGKDTVTEDMIKSMELEAVGKAQAELNSDDTGATGFYCVGHSVVNYKLDGYPIKNLVGHRGKRASVELIAAFLPAVVVESLYSVMDMVGLEVSSLTLEPIAAMNVIIPPEVRLINVALADIGAGTTDIAVSRNGSIVAYAMATIAGDEITEEIIRKFLVDFDTAERMKLTPAGQPIEFTDILGFEHSIDAQEFYSNLFPAVEQLADTIAENIVSVNGTAPAAVFLVGGGSLIPELPGLVADKLDLPATRVAIGGQKISKNIVSGNDDIMGPEYVTPIGIGITATKQAGYDFSTITLNGSKLRIFDTKALTAAELLMNAGYKPPQIIGRSGRSLTFTLNGEKQSFRGEPSVPGEISINGRSASLESTVKQGDVVDFKPAKVGMNAAITISDIAGEICSAKVFVDGTEYVFGRTARANDTIVSGDYSIQNYDSITIETIETLGDLILSLPYDCSGLAFFRNGRQLGVDYLINENDYITTTERSSVIIEEQPNRARDIVRQSEARRNEDFMIDEELAAYLSDNSIDLSDGRAKPVPIKPIETEEETTEESSQEPQDENEEEVPVVVSEPVTVFLNSKRVTLPPNSDNSPHVFLELMAVADIDISNPPPSGNMILTLNDKNASFMDPIHDDDNIVIKWDVK